MFGFSFSKKKVAEYKSGVPQEIIEQIKNVNEDEQLVEINAKIQKFEALLKEKKNEFFNTNYPAGDGRLRAKIDSDSDAQELIENGVDHIENFTTIHPENRKRDINRQIAALTAAISRLTLLRQERYREAIREGCQNLPVEVEQVYRNILIAARELAEFIEAGQKMDLILSQKSLNSEIRPPILKVLPFFIEFLYGYPGRPSVKFILENQEKMWAAHDEVAAAIRGNNNE